MSDYTEKGAKISACGKYRYRLWREWRGTHDPANWRWLGDDGNGQRLGVPKPCLFIMLNPSTADGEQDDPTIRRCVGFAKALRFERLEVVNLFAYRATQPAEMLSLRAEVDPIGRDNQEVIEELAGQAGIIICAWGALGHHMQQDETVLGWLGGKGAFALGLTAQGLPRHPLYLPSKSEPVPFGRVPKT